MLFQLAAVLLFLGDTRAQLSTPCPSKFQYGADGMASLTIDPPSIPGHKIHLQVRLYTPNKQPPKYPGQIFLVEDKNKLNKRLLRGSRVPIQYKIDFPTQPVLKDIVVNQHVVCRNTQVGDESQFEVNLAHTFFPDGNPSDFQTTPSVSILPVDGECGTTLTTTALIQHGESTVRGQWPWHAAIYWLQGRNQEYKCGATLVSLRTVITAAHCVVDQRGVAKDPGKMNVYLGKYQLNLWSEEGAQLKQVSSVFVHPSYNSSNYHFDLAVLILTSPASFNQFVRPACIWGSPDAYLQAVVDQLGYVVGWGLDENGEYADDLKLSRLPVVSDRECLTSYPELFSQFTNNKTFCAGYRNGTTPCNGDSGGGMVFPIEQPDDSKLWLLRGVVSLSASKPKDDKFICDANHYVVFTDLAMYRDWITKLIK